MAVLLAHACRNPFFYEENALIPSGNWEYAHIPGFEVNITDNAARYDVFVRVRHTSGYPFANLFLLLHEKGSGLRDTAFRHEMTLAEPDGRWTGAGAGSLFESRILAKADFLFPDTGTYRFGLEQNMRTNPLKGIADVGLQLVKKP